MIGKRILYSTLLAVWMGACLWWAFRTNACGCSTAHSISTGTASASLIQLGPGMVVTESGGTQAISEVLSDEAKIGVIEEKRVLAPLLIPFVKNRKKFEFDEEAQKWLEQAKADLRTNASNIVTVSGHTDGDGNANLNKRLSLQRAELVKAQLLEMGFPNDRVTAIGMGSAEPIADDHTSKGKATNRRVEVRMGRRL